MPMNSTTLIQIRELLEKLIPLLQEDVSTLKQEASRQEPLIQRLLQREIEAREALIPELKEGVKQLKSPIPPSSPVNGPITVIMPDGERIEEKTAIGALEKTIKMIGIEKVKSADVIAVKRRKLPLISEDRDSRWDSQKQLGQYWLFRNSSADMILNQLETINLCLKIGMQIKDNRKEA